MIDKNLNWQSRIKLVESKISQKILKSYLKIVYTWITNVYQLYISHLYIHIKITVILHGLVHPRLNLEKILTKQKQNISHK